MNKDELEDLLRFLNEERLDRSPSGSAKNIRKWLDGYSAACDMVWRWAKDRKADQERKEKFEKILESVDEGKKKEEGKLLFEEIPEDIWTDEEMEWKEDKALITRRLGEVLVHTRAGFGIFKMEYKKIPERGEEHVIITWADEKNVRTQTVDVTADSGIALIKDVVEAIK